MQKTSYLAGHRMTPCQTDASQPAARPEVHANFKAVTTSEVMSVELLRLFVP